jgi:hypothetical protein
VRQINRGAGIPYGAQETRYYTRQRTRPSRFGVPGEVPFGRPRYGGMSWQAAARERILQNNI